MRSILEIKTRELKIAIYKKIKQGLKDKSEFVTIKEFFNNEQIVGEFILEELKEANYKFEQGNNFVTQNFKDLIIYLEIK